MCNDYRLMMDVASIVEGFADLKIKIRFSEGSPNIQAREDIKITDMGPIIRSIEGMPGETDLVQRRWSWPGQNKRLVYNFRSDGREFASNRCLIVADGFYEFTDPVEKGKSGRTNGSSPNATSRYSASREFGVTPKMSARLSRELSPKVGEGVNRGRRHIVGVFEPPLLHRRSDMPCPTIPLSN
jgi:putative SOS response-associated peptidase YedK